MSAHYGVCLEADEVREVLIKEKLAWAGRVSANTSVTINKENLFGGILKEGGAQGRVDFMFGAPTQKASSWLASKLGRSVDNSPGYRGMFSLIFRGMTPQRGFYWTASTPYLGAIWTRLTRYPRSLTPEYARIPRATYSGPMSVFFVIDDSGSMAGSRMSSLQAAISHIVDQLPVATRLDIGGATMNGRSLSFRNATAAQRAEFKEWVNSLVANGGTNFNTGMVPAVNWFRATASDTSLGRRLCFFFSDGAPDTGSDNAAAATAASLINRTIPVDIYAINIQETNISAAAKLDNTPEDGVPVVSGENPDELTATMTAAFAEAHDANAAHIIYECMTNTDWGLGWSPEMVDRQSFLDAARTLHAEQLGLSLAWTHSASVESFTNDILDCIKGSLFTNPRTGQLTIRLIRDDYDRDELRQINPDNARLRNFARKAWGETVGEMKVTWTNPATEQPETVYSQDLGNIAMQGAVISDSRNYHGVRRADLAQRLANRELRQASAPLCSCEATVDREMWDITPFDCVRLSWPDYGVEDVVMRVIDINYGSSGASEIKLSLVEDIFSLPEVTFTEPATGEWENPDVPQAPISHARIFPVPAYMAAQIGLLPGDIAFPATSNAVLAADPGGSPHTDYSLDVEEPTPSGGLEWVPLGEPRTLLGTATTQIALRREAYSTVLLENIRGQQAWVNSFLLIGPVDAPADQLELALVVAVNDETAEVTMLRGALDTIPGEWPAGTAVWVGSLDEFDPVPVEYVTGQTVRIRVGSELAESGLILNAVAESRASRPLRPADVRIDGVGFSDKGVLAAGPVTFTWAHRNRLLEDVTVLSWTDASTVPEPGVTYRIDGQPFNAAGQPLSQNWYSEQLGLVDSHTLDLSALPVPPGTAQLRFQIVAQRDGEDSWQNYTVRVNILSAPTNLTIEPLE